MKSLLYNVITLAVQASSSDKGPPPPSQNRGPGLPIDDNIWILIIAGVLLGVYILYKRNSITNKAS